MSISEKNITHDTALYQAYEAAFGQNKKLQLTFCDVEHLLNQIGLRNDYIVSHLFQVMDEDHGGTVDFAEMNHFCHTLALGTRQEKAAFMFASCDTNGDGNADKEEMREMVEALVLACNETLPGFKMLKTEADVALCHGMNMDKIAIIATNRLVYQMFREADSKKTQALTISDFDKWIATNGPTAQEFIKLFAVIDHLLAKH